MQHGKRYDCHREQHVCGLSHGCHLNVGVERRGGRDPAGVDREGEAEGPEFRQTAVGPRAVLRVEDPAKQREGERHKGEGEGDDLVRESERPADLRGRRARVPVGRPVPDRGMGSESR